MAGSKESVITYAIFKTVTFSALVAVGYYGFLSLALYPKLRDHAPKGYEGLVLWTDFGITLGAAIALLLLKSVLVFVMTPLIKPILKD
jgi:hypothetical protein